MPTKSLGTIGPGILYIQKDDGSYEKCADVNMSWDNEVSIADLEEQEVVFDVEFGGEKAFEGSFTIKPPVIIDGEYKEVE